MKYVVYRVGSNAANQHLIQRLPVGIVEVKSKPSDPIYENYLTACVRGEELPGAGCYPNQHIECVPLTRTSHADREAALEFQQWFSEWSRELNSWDREQNRLENPS